MHYIIIGIILLVIGFYVIWILGVLLLRVIGIVATGVIVVAAVGLLVGTIAGLVMPIRVLRSMGGAQPDVATPAAVREGRVFVGGPTGFSANFGWDPGWPLYVPYQLRFDQGAVLAEAKRMGGAVHRTVRARVPDPVYARVICFLIFGIPTWAVIGGIWLGTLLWVAVTWVLAQITRFTQIFVLRSMRAHEVRFMKKNGSTVRCTRCYNTFPMPSYRCSNAACGRIHRDVSPGPLGIRSRICECGTELPLTVARASQSLAAICPFCVGDQPLPEGSGSRRVVVVPVFGAVGAGKTRFLASSAVSLYMLDQTAGSGLKFTALSAAAGQFLSTSFDEAVGGRAPVKTERRETPEGYPFLVAQEDQQFELHLMDAAGENFTDAEASTSLRYLDVAGSLVYLFDPLAIPEVSEQLRQGGYAEQFQVAQGSAGDSYGSVVDRLRNSGADVHTRRIAVVVTKADAIAKVMPTDPLPQDSAGVQDWLFRHGEDRLVSRIEMDFDTVDFFAVASLGGSLPDSDQHPVRIIDWALTSSGGSPLFPSAPSAQTTPEVAA